jgi:phosphatidylinositol alpha-1,6-mannosyltransferase
MAEILFVSKPVEPPWNDGSKTMVRDLAASLRAHAPVVLGSRGSTFAPEGARVDRVVRASGGHALSTADGARVLARLAVGRGEAAWHFFFQPNPRTSRAARAIARLRRMPVIHTVASAPSAGVDPRRVLFADRTVALSRATESRLLEAGVRGVARIAPPVRSLAVPTEDERRAARAAFGLSLDAPLIVFPGDLERGEGAARCIDALRAAPDAVLALAFRRKSAATDEAESALRARAARLGVATRVRWIGETDRILALLGAAHVVALPSIDLAAKVDLPIVLIESMWMARPVIVAAGAPAEELAEGGGALAIGADALADEIALLLGSSARRAALGARAREVASARYDPSVVARAYESLYDGLLGTHSA